MEDANIFVDKEVYPATGGVAPAREQAEIEIPAGISMLLRRWMKERDALSNQISGVLQALVVGKPGVRDLDESASFMIKSAPAQTEQTER